MKAKFLRLYKRALVYARKAAIALLFLLMGATFGFGFALVFWVLFTKCWPIGLTFAILFILVIVRAYGDRR